MEEKERFPVITYLNKEDWASLSMYCDGKLRYAEVLRRALREYFKRLLACLIHQCFETAEY